MMSVNEQVLGLVAMAVAIVAILTVGTLIAADIIHLGPGRTAPVPEAERNPLHPTKRSHPAPAPTARHGGPEGRQPSNAA